MTETIVETGRSRQFRVAPQSAGAQHLTVTDTLDNDRIFSYIDQSDATKLGLALIGENATVIADLPKAQFEGSGWVEADGYTRSRYTSAETVLKNAKALLAIHALIVKAEAEKEAAKVAEAEAVKAKEAARDKRRAELVTEFSSCGWSSLTRPAREAYDRIIDLEEAAKVS